MSYLEPEADKMASDEEESGEETLPSKTNQVVKLNVSTSGARTAKPSQLPVDDQDTSNPRKSPRQRREKGGKYFPLITRLISEQREEHTHKLEDIKEKLKKKSNKQLADLYNGTNDRSFREIIRDVFHEKRMAVLRKWDEKIQAQE
ncbi:hypothetical protein KCU77_g3465, partial [Aureobasidium melanogenum]